MGFNYDNLRLFFILFFCVFGAIVYRGLILGWAGMSKFRILGAIRAVTQSLRFEVRLIFVCFSFIFLNNSFSLLVVGGGPNKIVINVFGLLILLFIFVVEYNRPPFDFIEGESELVSGFNVEYAAGVFAFIFIGEYLFILVLRLFLSILISLVEIRILFFFLIIVALLFRCFFPRYRYDLLIGFFWNQFLCVTRILLFYGRFFNHR